MRGHGAFPQTVDRAPVLFSADVSRMMRRSGTRARIAAVTSVLVLCLNPGYGFSIDGESIVAQEESGTGDLFTRVGLTSTEAATALAGRPAVRVLPSDVDTEVAVAGGIRIRGNVERLVLWLRDIEEFRRSLGTEAVRSIDRPPRPENFAAISGGDVDVQLLREHATKYQKGGDRALGGEAAPVFQDMVRRAATLWRLARELAVYLEDFPAQRPTGIEDHFYWTREATARKPVTTLHHVVVQQLPDRSLRFADKQFYASRDIDVALLVAQATPTADGRSFDLVVSLRARVPRLGSMAARLLRNRVSQEMSDAFAMYLDWLRRSFALG